MRIWSIFPVGAAIILIIAFIALAAKGCSADTGDRELIYDISKCLDQGHRALMICKLTSHGANNCRFECRG
jgi:hypothetical protein